MANPYLPRATVHEWSEQIGNNPTEHQAALSRLLRDQRRLSKFVEENKESLTPATAGVAMYLVGVIIRLFEQAGGRLRGATWEQIRAASGRIENELGNLLPVDDRFPERVRAVSWRAQPHILDEALMALFDRPSGANEQDLAGAEKAKVTFLLWAAIEVLDENWTPKPGFTGDKTYTYVKIDPTAKV